MTRSLSAVLYRMHSKKTVAFTHGSRKCGMIPFITTGCKIETPGNLPQTPDLSCLCVGRHSNELSKALALNFVCSNGLRKCERPHTRTDFKVFSLLCSVCNRMSNGARHQKREFTMKKEADDEQEEVMLAGYWKIHIETKSSSISAVHLTVCVTLHPSSVNLPPDWSIPRDNSQTACSAFIRMSDNKCCIFQMFNFKSGCPRQSSEQIQEGEITPKTLPHHRTIWCNLDD